MTDATRSTLSPPHAPDAVAAVAENRKHMRLADEERVKNLVSVAGNFRTIILDPAWMSGRSYGGLPYVPMTQEQILALPVLD
jgi:hypothetical protein